MIFFQTVLDRVKAFLPLMEQANKKLEEDLSKNPDAVNIEQVDEDKPYIQMVRQTRSHFRSWTNLGLLCRIWVFQPVMKKMTKISATKRTMMKKRIITLKLKRKTAIHQRN